MRSDECGDEGFSQTRIVTSGEGTFFVFAGRAGEIGFSYSGCDTGWDFIGLGIAIPLERAEPKVFYARRLTLR